MSEHWKEREDLLAAVLAGELSEEDRRLQELIAQDPELYEELKDVASRLESCGSIARQILAEAASRTTAPGSERVEATLRAEIQRTAGPARSAPPSPPRRPSAAAPWLVAAAAVLAAVWLAFTFTGRRDVPASGGHDVELGGLPIDELAPAGKVERIGEFRWRCPLPNDGFFELQIDDARREFTGEANLLERIPGLIEPRWTPDEQRVAGWPAKIRWRVRALDGSRAEIGRSDWVEVERSSE